MKDKIEEIIINYVKRRKKINTKNLAKKIVKSISDSYCCFAYNEPMVTIDCKGDSRISVTLPGQKGMDVIMYPGDTCKVAGPLNKTVDV